MKCGNTYALVSVSALANPNRDLGAGLEQRLLGRAPRPSRHHLGTVPCSHPLLQQSLT